MRINLLAGIALLALTNPSLAGEIQTPPGRALTVNSGTLGYGMEADWRFAPDWGLRAGVNMGRWSYLYRAKKADFRSDIFMLNGGLTADYYPGDQNFRLSGGARLSANQITGRVENIRKVVKIFGTKGTAIVKDPLTRYTVTQNPVQPYLGIGYSHRYSDRLTFNVDLGGLYTGAPDINVVSHVGRLGFSEKQIRRETERAQRRAADYQFYPVIQFGFKLRF